MTEEKEFRVIDKRASSSPEVEKAPNQAKGESFTMKDRDISSTPTASQVDFSTLILSLATGALINLGLAPDPATKKTQKNTELAKQTIDILSILAEKTKGNLTPEENQLIENLLTETRLRFVEAARASTDPSSKRS